MCRYLRLVKSTNGTNGSPVGPAPTARRFHLDYATWHARLAGSNGSSGPIPVGSARVVHPDAGRRAA